VKVPPRSIQNCQRRPSGTCPPPIRPTTSTPRTWRSSRNDVDKATGGKLKITVHANASLFKAPEIKRAVQGGQAQIGEILLVNFENEWPIYGVDGLPFLADSYADSLKLYKASQKPRSTTSSPSRA
jgi:TRAP-type C4-dicarboxylate transport system substrate-binding protein